MIFYWRNYVIYTRLIMYKSDRMWKKNLVNNKES